MATMPSVILFSFAAKQASAPDTRYRFDVSSCRDPIGQAHLKGTCADGRDEKVLAWLEKDPKVKAVIETVGFLVGLHMLPPQSEANISIGFHDHHGIWIAPAVAILAGREISRLSLASVSLVHEAIARGWGGIHLKAAGKAPSGT